MFAAALTEQAQQKDADRTQSNLNPPTCSDGSAVSSHNVLAARLISIIHIYEHASTTTTTQPNSHIASGHQMMKAFEMI